MRIWQRIKALGRRVQALAVRVGLAGLYVFGFGLVHLYLLVFRRTLLSPRPPVNGSYWLPCQLGPLDPTTSRRQS